MRAHRKTRAERAAELARLATTDSGCNAIRGLWNRIRDSAPGSEPHGEVGGFVGEMISDILRYEYPHG